MVQLRKNSALRNDAANLACNITKGEWCTKTGTLGLAPKERIVALGIIMHVRNIAKGNGQT